MPLQRCSSNGLSGYRWGNSGKCYTYPAGDEDARKEAKRKAILQGAAVEGGNLPANPAALAEAAKTKTCSECGQSRSIESFSADKRTTDGFGTVCSRCRFAGVGGVGAEVRVPLAFEEFSLEEARALLDLADDAPLEPDEDGELVLSDDQIAVLAEIGVEGLDRLYVKADDGDAALPTVTLRGVEILAAGGPYFGQGSPKEGDFFDEAYLKKLAANNTALADEVRPPNKVGHSKKQTLLKNSGLSLDEQPAAGWLTNFRVKGGKLLADIPNVPRKLARILKSGGFRTRSVELKTVTAQSGPLKGKKVQIVSGLAWLGAVAPAVRTLDDIVKLYAADDPDDALSAAELLAADEPLDPEVDVRSVDLAAGDVIWKPEEGMEWLRSEVRKALNPGPNDYRYWVEDIAPDKALVSDGKEYWVVPYTVDAGQVTVSPSSDWTLASKAWVEEAAGYREAALEGREKSADTSSGMPETTKPKLTDEQIIAFAEALGIEEADDAKRREAVEAKLTELAPVAEQPPAEPTEPTEPAPAEPTEPTATGMSETEKAEFEVLRRKAERGDTAYEERRLEKREATIVGAMKANKIHPSKREFWEGVYDENEERCITLLAEMPVDPNLVGVYGADDDDLGPESQSGGDAQYAEVAGLLGIKDAPSLQKRAA